MFGFWDTFPVHVQHTFLTPALWPKRDISGCRGIQFGLTAGSKIMTESALTFGKQRIFPGLGFGGLQAQVRSLVHMEKNPENNTSWFQNPA